MKGITILLITLILWYFAGMFRQTNVMALAVCMLVLAVLLIILSFYQRHKLSVRLSDKKLIAFKGAENIVPVFSENRSLLPVNKYKITLAVKYRNSKTAVKKRFTGCAAGRRMKEGRRAEFFLTAPYCGIIDIELKRLRVYDNLSLFSSSKKASGSCQLLVFPSPKYMNIILPSGGSYDDLPLSDSRSDKAGDDHSEVRLIREYRPGDLSRHIHHNYSAKTGAVWVKEYYKENDYILDLYLNTASSENAVEETWDAYYEIAISIIFSLLSMNFFLHIHWYDGEKGGLVETEIKSTADLADLLTRLYSADKICTQEEFSGVTDTDSTGIMMLNMELEWTVSGRTVYRFDPQKAEAELTSAVFSL